jgi:hypothetical protein
MLPSQYFKKTVAVALALTAITPAMATAKPTGTTPFGEKYAATPATTIVRVTTPASGFDWADAGIGAAGGLALTLLGVGAALTISGRRTPDSARQLTARPSPAQGQAVTRHRIG